MLDQLAHKELSIFISLVTLFIVVYAIAYYRTTRSTTVRIDTKRRRINSIKGILVVAVAASAFFIWSDQIYSTTISFAALAAGTAIAIKEILLCLEGSFYRTSMVPYQVGDRIEIDNKRGDVIEIGLLGSKLLEVGPEYKTHQYTGRTISIPHSYLLSHSVKNETYFHDFVLHMFDVPVERNREWKHHQEVLLDCAMKECQKYITSAQKHFEKLAKKRYIEVPIIEPRVTIKLEDSTTVQLIVRVTVPSRIRGQIEQRILNAYLKKIL